MGFMRDTGRRAAKLNFTLLISALSFAATQACSNERTKTEIRRPDAAADSGINLDAGADQPADADAGSGPLDASTPEDATGTDIRDAAPPPPDTGPPSSWSAFRTGGPWTEYPFSMEVTADRIYLGITEHQTSTQEIHLAEFDLLGVQRSVLRATGDIQRAHSSLRDPSGARYLLFEAGYQIQIGAAMGGLDGYAGHIVRIPNGGTAEWLEFVPTSLFMQMALRPAGGICYASTYEVGCLDSTGEFVLRAPLANAEVEYLFVDSSNRVLITGVTHGTATLADTTLPIDPGGGGLVFAARLSADGTADGAVDWAETTAAPSGLNPRVFDAALTPSGKLMILARADATYEAVALAAFDGTRLWEQLIDGFIDFPHLTLDGEDVYVTASFEQLAELGGMTLTNNFGDSDVLIARYNASGSFQRVRQSTADDVLGACMGPNGTLYLVGRVRGTATFQNLTVTSAFGGYYLASYLAGGSVGLAELAFEGGNSSLNHVRCAGAALFIAGGYQFDLTYGPAGQQLPAQGGTSIFILRREWP